MPFVIMCGIPSSGKSTRAAQLNKYLNETSDRTIHLISDHGMKFDKNHIYADSRREKDIRSELKSEVQRKISKDDVVIFDSLNYIKGYRYELFCVTKSAQTPQCVILCETNPTLASEWNKTRPLEDRYDQEIFDGLVMRFEPPESRNRWDSPLFVIQADDSLPFEAISDAIFQKKAPPPNMSTQTQPLSSTNFLYELDRKTQEVVNIIVQEQKTAVPGDKINVQGAAEKVNFVRNLTLHELQRCRRQFIAYTKMHPVTDCSSLPNMFVQYMNSSI